MISYFTFLQHTKTADKSKRFK